MFCEFRPKRSKVQSAQKHRREKSKKSGEVFNRPATGFSLIYVLVVISLKRGLDFYRSFKMSSETKVYTNGPDQIILEASDFCNSNPDGAVKIRDHDPQSLVSDPPISVPSILERTAKKYPDHPALCVKRDGAWVEWTYKQVTKLRGLPQG